MPIGGWIGGTACYLNGIDQASLATSSAATSALDAGTPCRRTRVPGGVLTGALQSGNRGQQARRFRMISCQLDEMDLPVRIDGNDPHDRPVRRGTGHQDPGWHDTALRRTAKFRPRRPRRSDRSGARSGESRLLLLPTRRIGHHTVSARIDYESHAVGLDRNELVTPEGAECGGQRGGLVVIHHVNIASRSGGRAVRVAPTAQAPPAGYGRRPPPAIPAHHGWRW